MTWIPVVAATVVVLFVVAAWSAARVLVRVAAVRAETGAIEASVTQRRAWWALGIGSAAVAAATAWVSQHGALAYGADEAVRYPAMGIIFAGALLTAVAVAVVRPGEGEVAMDERDRAALTHAPSLQFAAALITLVAWTIWLQESFRDAGAVPVDYVNLVFFSVFLAGMLAWPAGLLLGYVAVDLRG